MDKLPPLYRITQLVEKGKITSIEECLLAELKAQGTAERLQPGARVAIAVGSRGIAGLSLLVKTLVEWLKEQECRPLLLTAMGSHGEATAQGQIAVLKSYGITEEKIGAPITASMDVVEIGRTSAGTSVYFNREALGCDAIILLNRVKPHTTMQGPVQSGLMKMMAVGLGNREGAESMHRFGLERSVPDAANIILKKTPVLFGVALLENARKELYKISVIPAAQIPEKEKPLLREAQRILPLIPCDPVDVLLVRRMGKNISGTGMDTNVVGRWRRIGGPVDRVIGRIGVFDLTDESKGNGLGVGMADCITSVLSSKIDIKVTRTNAQTSGWPEGARVPPVLRNEADVCRRLLQGFVEERVRLVLIESTMQLETFWVSAALKEELAGASFITAIDGPLKVDFDPAGNLILPEGK
ncbi:MAG: lactate racemase domain-containing protein [Bacillota bacterium]